MGCSVYSQVLIARCGIAEVSSRELDCDLDAKLFRAYPFDVCSTPRPHKPRKMPQIRPLLTWVIVNDLCGFRGQDGQSRPQKQVALARSAKYIVIASSFTLSRRDVLAGHSLIFQSETAVRQPGAHAGSARYL